MSGNVEPRGVNERLAWMKVNPPGLPGMCARTCWLALGGDYGNPPRWYARNANEVYDKIVASGRFWRSDPPKGALVVWKYGKNGHTALSMGDGRIMTTDPNLQPGKCGVEDISYPHRWGANSRDRLWTDEYNGSRFKVGEDKPEKPDDGGDDMTISRKDASLIAARVWRADVVASPHGKDSDNPTWAAGTYMRKFLNQMQKQNELLERVVMLLEALQPEVDVIDDEDYVDLGGGEEDEGA